MTNSSTTPANPAQGVTNETIDNAVVEAINALRMEHTGRAYDILHEALTAAIGAGGQAVAALPENILEDAAKSAFVKAQSVYRADHDHFPLKTTWGTTVESVREGWRSIAYAALEAAYMPPLGTQPEPRHPRDVASALSQPHPVDERVDTAGGVSNKAEEGRQAYKNRQSKDSNPYPQGSARYWQWSSGWLDERAFRPHPADEPRKLVKDIPETEKPYHGPFPPSAPADERVVEALPRPDAVSMASGTICLEYVNRDERDLAFDWLEAHGAGAGRDGR